MPDVLKSQDPLHLSAATVYAVTGEALREAGYQSVDEALAQLPGLFVTRDLVDVHVGLRGALGGQFAGSRLLKIMINRVPVSFVYDETYWSGAELVPLSAVERVEVVLGPISSMYGSGALVGVVNIVTKDLGSSEAPKSLQWEVQGTASGGLGGQESGGAEAMARVVSEDLGALVAWAGHWRDRSGLRIPENSPFASDHQEADAAIAHSQGDTSKPQSAYGRVVYRDPIGGEVSLAGMLQRRDSGAEFYPLTVLTHESRVDLFHWKTVAGYEWADSDHWSTLVQGFVAGGGVGDSDTWKLRRSDRFYRERSFGFLQVGGNGELKYAWNPSDFILIGSEANHDQIDLPTYTETSLDTGLRSQGLDAGAVDLTGVAGFLQGGFAPWSWLRLSTSGRLDWHSVYGTQWAARGAIVSPLWDERLVLKFSGGTSFKGPSAQQLYATPLAELDIVGDSALKPQRMTGLEASISLRPLDWTTLSVNAFLNDFDNLLAYEQTRNQLLPTNYQANTVGGEVSLTAEGSPSADWSLQGVTSYALQNTQVDETRRGGLTEKPFPDNENVPIHMLKGAGTVRWKPLKLALSAQYQWIGDRTPSNANLLENNTADFREPSYILPAYHLLDATLRAGDFALGQLMRWSVLLRATNLLASSYMEMGFNGVDVPSLGQTFWLQLSVNYGTFQEP